MKKLLLLLLLFLCVSQRVAFAQEQDKEPRHEIFAGYGVLSLQVMGNYFGNFFIGSFFGTGQDMSSAGPVMLGYNYWAGEKISIGVTGSYTTFSARFNESGELDFRNRYYTIVPRVDYHWAKRENVNVYSGLGLGASLLHTHYGKGRTNPKDLGVGAAIQVNCVGIRVGRKVGGFFEMGFGFNGLVNAGINARL